MLAARWRQILHSCDGRTGHRRAARGAAACLACRRRAAAARARADAARRLRRAGGDHARRDRDAIGVAPLPRGDRCRCARRLRVCRLAGVAAPRRDPARDDRRPRHRRHGRRRQPAATRAKRTALSLRHRDGAPAGVPATLALGWYAGLHEDAALVQPRQALRAGQRWRVTVWLRQPHGNLNPSGFDYELALFEQGVRATGYVRDAPSRRCSRAAPAIRSSDCASAFATRSTSTSPTGAPPASWPRSRSATRARSSAVYRQSSSTLALPMKRVRCAACVDKWSYGAPIVPVEPFDNRVLLWLCGPRLAAPANAHLAPQPAPGALLTRGEEGSS
jgi:hypothetical protein